MKPDDCATMTDVRAGVDALDRELAALLGVRFGYMRAAARLKAERGAVRDESRKAAVIGQAEVAAHATGVPAGLAAQLWEILVEASIAYELTEFDARSSTERGASDGTRTRGLRRDRPAL